MKRREGKQEAKDADQGQSLEAALAVCVAVALPYPAGGPGARLGGCDDHFGLLYKAFGGGELLCAVDVYSGMFRTAPLSPLSRTRIDMENCASNLKTSILQLPFPISSFTVYFGGILLTPLHHTSSSPFPPSPSPLSSSPASSTSTVPSSPSTTSTSTASSPSSGASASRCCHGTSASPSCIAARSATGPPRRA